MKNYVDILEERDLTSLLGKVFKEGVKTHIIDPEVETVDGVKKLKFSLIADNQLRFGEAYFGNFNYEVLLRYPNSLHGETVVVKKPYAQFMMEKINERIANGDNSFTVDGYASDYNEFIKREYDKQIQEVEREYFDNVLYSKDKPLEKGE